MNKAFALAVFLFCAVRVQAQIVGPPVSVPLHGAPQGVTSCVVPENLTVHTIGTGICPLVSFQTHWKPGSGNRDLANVLITNLAHTHIECNLPLGGELSGPVRLPCRLQLFHTAGQIAVENDFGQVTEFTMDPPTPTQANAWPVVGNPNGVVIANFHVTFDPRQQMKKGDPGAQNIPDHGYAVLVFYVRTFFDNGDTTDTHMQWPIWSMVHPESPIAPEGEATRVNLSTMSTAVSVRDTTPQSWGTHLIEFRDLNLPIFAPIAVPYAVNAFAYTYSNNNPFLTEYHLVCDNDYHNAVAGTEMTFVTARTPISGEPFNHDFIDPLKLSQSTPPAGFPPTVHRCTAIWMERTPDDAVLPSPTTPGGFVAAGEQLFSLMSVDVAVGPNPVGCDATCSNAIGASPTVPTPPPPPLTCTAPAVLTNGQCVTPPPPPPALTVVKIQMCAIETLSDGSTKNRCLDLP